MTETPEFAKGYTVARDGSSQEAWIVPIPPHAVDGERARTVQAALASLHADYVEVPPHEDGRRRIYAVNPLKIERRGRGWGALVGKGRVPSFTVVFASGRLEGLAQRPGEVAREPRGAEQSPKITILSHPGDSRRVRRRG